MACGFGLLRGTKPPCARAAPRLLDGVGCRPIRHRGNSEEVASAPPAVFCWVQAGSRALGAARAPACFWERSLRGTRICACDCSIIGVPVDRYTAGSFKLKWLATWGNFWAGHWLAKRCCVRAARNAFAARSLAAVISSRRVFVGNAARRTITIG